MSCETCKNRESEAIDGATKESRLMAAKNLLAIAKALSADPWELLENK